MSLIKYFTNLFKRNQVKVYAVLELLQMGYFLHGLYFDESEAEHNREKLEYIHSRTEGVVEATFKVIELDVK